MDLWVAGWTGILVTEWLVRNLVGEMAKVVLGIKEQADATKTTRRTGAVEDTLPKRK